MKVSLGTVVAAFLLATAACSSSGAGEMGKYQGPDGVPPGGSQPGSPGLPESPGLPGGGCIDRCNRLVAKCGVSDANCEQTCATFNPSASQWSCLEGLSCQELKDYGDNDNDPCGLLSTGGQGGTGGGANCSSVCESKVTECQLTDVSCDSLCAEATAAQVACAQAATCEQLPYCFISGTGGTSGTGGMAGAGGTGGGTTDCLSGCIAFTTECGLSSAQCDAICQTATPTQLACLAAATCTNYQDCFL